jgi:PAS domain S-box-containing protein
VPGPDGTVRYLLHAAPAGPGPEVPPEYAYHSLLDRSPVATAFYYGPDSRIDYANPAMLRQWGRDNRVLGQPVAEALPELAGQPFVAQLQQVYATGQTYMGSRQPTPLRGGGAARTAYLSYTLQPLRTAAGQLYGVYHSAVDKTAEVLAAQQLAESERRFRALVEQAPVPILLSSGPEVVIESINAPMLRLIGRSSAAEVLGRPLRAVLPHLETEAILSIVQAVGESGQPYVRNEVPVAMPDAAGALAQHYFNVSYTPLLVGGLPQGVLHMAVDVTAQVQARQQLEASREALLSTEERFRIMADAAPCLVWALHPDATVRYANQSFLSLLGFSLPEYLATGRAAYLHPDEAATGLLSMQRRVALQAGQAQEYRVRRPDGQHRWLLAQGAPAYHPGGGLYGYVGSAIDITDLKEANEQLVRTNADLDTFIYTASHDLKAPITNIEGLVAMLERVLPPAAREGRPNKVLALMHDAIGRFRRTLHELTDIVRLQHTPAEEATPVSLPAVLDAVCLDLDPQLRETGAQVVRELLPCPLIRFSARHLRSIVYNLVGNALKYRAPGRPPVVELTCHTTPQHHVLVVRDNGVGFEPARAEQLFLMYQRLHDHVEGSGVGLYLVRRMLEQAGGRIEATGEVGVGATFTVYFAR